MNPDLVELSTILSSSDPEILSDDTLWNSAVCLLLYPKDGDYCILFNKRTELVEFNKGDICFPGGAQDPEDSHLTDTAKREVFEEMGIKVLTIAWDTYPGATPLNFRQNRLFESTSIFCEAWVPLGEPEITHFHEK